MPNIERSVSSGKVSGEIGNNIRREREQEKR